MLASVGNTISFLVVVSYSALKNSSTIFQSR